MGETAKPVLFSGSAPTGTLTIGNYLGALRQWVALQDTHDCLFSIVDLHAITVPRDPATLRQATCDFFALFIACGLDPSSSIVFVQSQNHYHAELAWILNGVTRYGELTRMTQFKEKARSADGVTAGLLNYPLLMAADILLYGATVVPVGEDQRQHIELAREIAQRFNALYGEVFTEPRALVPARAARIRNLLDPRRKMDKSDPDPRTWVSLLDPPDAVRQKIARAKTDSLGTFPIDREDEGIANLVTICSELGGGTRESIAERYGSRGYAALKADLAERLNQLLAPIQSRHREILQDPAGMARLMAVGRDRAMARAARAMARIRSAVGLAQP